MLTAVPVDVLLRMMSFLSMRDAASLRCTMCLYRGDTLQYMVHSMFAVRIQRVVRGVLARNNNPAATFVSLVYRTANSLVRCVQDGETDEGTPWCEDGPFWIVNFWAHGDEEGGDGDLDGDMLFVPAARSANAARIGPTSTFTSRVK